MLSEADWQTLISVKSAVNKQIESARNAKLVGGNLSAKVELWANESLQTVLNQLADELRFVLITSQVVVHPFAEQGEATEMEGLRVQVSAAEGEKCARCWHVLPDVNTCRSSWFMWSLYCERHWSWRSEKICLIHKLKGLFQFYPHNLIWLGLSVLAIVLDQWTKWIASTHLNYADPVPVLPF